MDESKVIQEYVLRAREAARVLATFDQVQVDRLVRAIGKVVYDNAAELARLAVDETGMGVYEDKVAKNKGKPRIIWSSLKNKKSVDIIGEDSAEGLIYIAKPMGVVGMVTPCTNPIVTPMCNCMFALKGRNAAIIAPHPKARLCGGRTVELFNQELARLGAPPDTIQIITEPSLELTAALMKAVNVVIATGGSGMVKAAYSSGKPSYGVGQGNVQVIIDRDVDLSEAAEKIIAGRVFDNGIICTGEQSVIAPAELYDRTIEAFRAHGAWYVEDEETVGRFRDVIFPGGGAISRDVVGQSVQTLAALAGVEVPAGTRVLLFKPRGAGRADALCKEKMCPAMVAFAYQDFSEAVEIARQNLLVEGCGHTVSLHSHDDAHIRYAGEQLPVSRVVVNQVCSTSGGGSFFNGLAPTTTLGCGSWGNNSISENLDYKHLINISRIALVKQDVTVPTDEEIWAETE
jgi:succinate-semialdehyde dehydrogenase